MVRHRVVFGPSGMCFMVVVFVILIMAWQSMWQCAPEMWQFATQPPPPPPPPHPHGGCLLLLLDVIVSHAGDTASTFSQLDLRNPEEYAGEMERVDKRWETIVKAERIFDRGLGWQPATVSERNNDGLGSTPEGKSRQAAEDPAVGAILHRVSILDRERFQKALLFNSMDIFTVAKVGSRQQQPHLILCVMYRV